MRNKRRAVILLLAGTVVLMVAFVGVVAVTGYQVLQSAADGQSAALADRRPSENESAIATGPERISLYSVPLGCPLVTGLGCGSESKPIMIKLDEDSAVAGTWLNHAGTTLAVLWKDGIEPANRPEVVAAAFQDSTAPTELSGDSREAALKNFLSGIAWYRATAMDELSTQEAEIVATRWVKKITAIIPLPQGAQDALHCQLAERMRRRFVGK